MTALGSKEVAHGGYKYHFNLFRNVESIYVCGYEEEGKRKTAARELELQMNTQGTVMRLKVLPNLDPRQYAHKYEHRTWSNVNTRKKELCFK